MDYRNKTKGREMVMMLLAEFHLKEVLSWPRMVVVVMQQSGLILDIYWK